MARELTTTQQTNVEAGATRPIYLVEWQHSGTTEYLSCSGDVLYGDGSPNQTYTAGGITIAGLEDSKTATLILPATAARVSEIQNNTWRGGTCKITAILALPGDSPVYAAADGLLVLDGVIESSSFSGESISVIAKSKYYTGALVPRFTYDDVVTSAPAVGAVSTWEGENYSYEQWLKTVAAIQRLVRPGVNPQVTGRPSVSQINSFEPIENPGQKLVTSQGQPIPIVYGRASVAGYVFAEGEYSGSKFVGVAWCMGRINSIEAVFINDAPVPSTVTAKHYLGTTTQTVSPALQLYIGTSPQYSDDMILRTPAGDIGIAYSVFNIPASAISGAPRFRAIIQGRLVPDPESTTTDPYEDYVEWSFNFLTGTTDSGPNARTLTLVGGAAIASPSIGLELDGTGDYATIPDGNDIGAQPFTLEIELQCDTAVTSPGAVETLFCKGITASPLSRSIQIDRVGNEVLLYLSSDGSTWDIANGLSCGTLNSTGSPEVTGRLLVERVGNQISTYMNGATQTGVVTSAALYNNGSTWVIGSKGGTQDLNGRVRSARLTIGQYRYGSPHAITPAPFSDSGTYQTGYVYSDNPALCWADLASDPVIGLGATTTGVQLAREYCDSPMTSGAPRCRIGLAITESRLVEAWLDQLAMYANALWFPEGANLKIIADRSKADGLNGSGPALQSVVDAWTPVEITTALWLDASDTTTITDAGAGAVSAWADKSGNSRDAAQGTSASQPTTGTVTVNGLNAIDFDGSNDWMAVSGYIPANTSGSDLSIFVVGNSTGASSRAMISTRSSTSTGFTLRTNSTTEMVYFHTGQTPNVTRAITAGVNLFETLRDGLSIIVGDNGNLSASSTLTGYTASAYNLTIGAEGAAALNRFDGPICEIILIESTLTTDERQIIEGYLAWKWGLEASLPTGHPYEDVRPGTVTVPTESGAQYSIAFQIDTPATTSPLVGVSVEFNGVTVISEQTAAGRYSVVVTAVGTSSAVEAVPAVSFDGTYSGLTIRRTHRLVDKWLPSTLSIQGAPEGDKPNAVEATYNIPSDTSGAWQQNTFPVISNAAAAGFPIVMTKLSLPGVNRIEEASNKAIATLYRNDNKTKVSLVSTDEEFVAQPGDTIQVTSTYRGIDTTVYVESNSMVSYGRHQITGIIYRDNQYPDLDYTTPRKWDGGGGGGDGPVVINIGPPDLDFCLYDCEAFESEFAAQTTAGGDSVVLWNPSGTFTWPFATNSTTGETLFRSYAWFISAPVIRSNWDGSGSGDGVRTATLSSWSYDEQIGYCDTPAYATNLADSISPNAIVLPSDSVDNEDYTAVIVFTGYNGGTTFDHEMVRNSGNFYRIYRGAHISLGTQSVTAIVRIGSNGSGGSAVTLSAGDSTWLDTATIDCGNISGQWSLLTVSMTNTAEIYLGAGFPFNGFSLGVTISATVTTASGETFSGSATGYNRSFYGYAVTEIAETTHTLYTQPRFCYDTSNDSISVAFLGYGPGASYDITSLQRAFMSNFESFEGGEWCY